MDKKILVFRGCPDLITTLFARLVEKVFSLLVGTNSAYWPSAAIPDTENGIFFFLLTQAVVRNLPPPELLLKDGQVPLQVTVSNFWKYCRRAEVNLPHWCPYLHWLDFRRVKCSVCGVCVELLQTFFRVLRARMRSVHSLEKNFRAMVENNATESAFASTKVRIESLRCPESENDDTEPVMRES